MGLFTKILALMTIAALLVLPYAASSSGWGIGSEKNPIILKGAAETCPDYQRTSNGTCRRRIRSYYYGRSHVGGGPRAGK